MASTFSIGEAYSAGFRVIGRHPLAPLAWGLVYSLVVLAPTLLLTVTLTGGLGFFGGNLANGNPQQAMARMGSLALIQPVQLLLTLAAMSILYAAIYRSVLRPEDSAAAYLRFGGDELRQALVMVVMWVLFFVLCAVVAIPLVIIFSVGAIGAAHGGTPSYGAIGSMVLFGFLAVLVMSCVLVWLFARFSMALPMTFATGQFRLFESWSLTRGRTWPLIGLILLQFFTLMAIYLVLAMIFFTAFGAMIFSHGLAGARTVGMAPSPSMVGGIFAGYMAFGVLVSGYLMAFMGAPWADVYRQIAAPGAADHFGPAPTVAPVGSIA